MRALLDTHVLLGELDDALFRKTKDIPEHAELYVSHVSLWEIEIKKALGKLDITEDFYYWLANRNVTLLPISIAHIQRVGVLPLHHRDPFDRMLVAQAQVEGLKLLTDDKQLASYDVVLL